MLYYSHLYQTAFGSLNVKLLQNLHCLLLLLHKVKRDQCFEART